MPIQVPSSIGAGLVYDFASRLIKVETGELAGWQSEAVAPSGWADFTIYRTAETAYDAMGRKVRDTLRDGAGGVAGTVRSVTQYSYDVLGRPECTAVRMNPAAFAALPASACTPGTAGSDGPDRISRNVYDAAGQRTQLREGVGSGDEAAEATWAYNDNGQIVTIIDGNGNRAELHYDGHGRQDRWTFPSALAPVQRPVAFNDSTQATALATAGAVNASDYEAYQSDPNGNRTTLRKRDGSVLAYSYDALNRVTVKTVPERTTGAQALTAAQTRDVYYSYDLRNLRLSARFDSQSGEGVVNSYDGFGRLSRSIADLGGTARQLDYAYDRNGNRTRITHADGNVFFGTAYDGMNRPVQLGANDATSLAYTTYTPYGAPALTLRIANHVATALGYDGVLRPTVRVHYFTPGTSNAVWSYGYNAASQLSSVARDNDAFAWTNHYAVNRAYTTNGLNQYSAAGGATFGYDANGNLTSDGSRTYVYDIENRLVSSSTGATLVYDPLGRLFQVSGPAPGGGTNTTRFLYDGDALVAEYDGSNTMLRRHVHNVGADVPMVTYEGADLSMARQLLADHQGSIVALADASGAAVTIDTYDEYGIPGTANTGRFQYTGQIWLPELGMYYYKARVYSPTLGRFMQTDPVGYQGGINLYGYVGDDPVNHTDPSGTISSCEPSRTPFACEVGNMFGGVKLFVRAVRRIFRRDGSHIDIETRRRIPTERSAQQNRRMGRNVDVEPSRRSSPTSRVSRRIEENVSGGNNTVRHEPHEDSPNSRRSHYQPIDRPPGPRGWGHTIYTGLGYFTAVGTMSPDAGTADRVISNVVDFFNPVATAQDIVGLISGDDD